MFKMPDEPERVIQYVVMFLPGFLVMGGVSHLTDRTLGDLAFMYLSVALSVALYLLTGALASLFARRRVAAAASSGSLGVAAFTALLAGLSLATMLVITLAVERDWGLRLLAKVGIVVEKRSTQGLLSYYFRHDHNGTVDSLDMRPTRLWETCGQGEKCQAYRYNIYARVQAGEVTYEGRVQRYTLDGASNALPFVLSPACRVSTARAKEGEATGGNETLSIVPGPGVVFLPGKVDTIELKEMCASACYRMVMQDDCKKGSS